MNIYKELQEKLSEHEPTEVDELILDDLFENVSAFSEQNKKDLERYKNLVHLSLNGFGLESLKNFPKIPTLQILEIRQNKLTGSDFSHIHELYPELYKLKVGENPIKSVDVFKPLANSKIEKVELQETPAAEHTDYKKTLFATIKTLRAVDSLNKDGEEENSTVYEDDEGEEYSEDDDAEFDENDDEMDEFDDEEGDDESGSDKPAPKKTGKK